LPSFIGLDTIAEICIADGVASYFVERQQQLQELNCRIFITTF